MWRLKFCPPLAQNNDDSNTKNEQNNTDSDTKSDNNLNLKGNFNQGTHASTFDKVLHFLVKPAYALNSSIVDGMVVFYADGQWKTGDVVNGEFSVNIRSDSPSVIAFYQKSTGTSLGYLAFGDGIDALPVNYLKQGTTEIDLKSLSSTGTSVSTNENIFSFTDNAENIKTVYATLDDFSAARAKNADMDGNGKIDVLENKEYRVKVTYFINAGNVDSNGQTTLKTGNDLLNGFKIFFDSKDTTPPSQVFFTGPNGSGMSNLPDDGSPNLRTGGNNTYFSSFITSPKHPPSGDYSINYGGTNLSFTLSDQSNFTNSIVLAKPNFIFDSSNKLTKIEWSWKNPSGSNDDDLAKKVISEVKIQIDGNSGRIFNSSELGSDINSSDIPNIDKNQISAVYFAYDDVFGNHYVTQYYF